MTNIINSEHFENTIKSLASNNIPNNTYEDLNGEEYIILSSSARTKVDNLLKQYLYLNDSKWTQIYRDSDYFGLEANHELTDSNRGLVYKAFDFTKEITDDNIKEILSKFDGLWNINIDETVDRFGDLNDGNEILCSSLSEKTKALSIWLLSVDLSPSSAGGNKSNYNKELRGRCKNGICFDDHLDKFTFSDSVDEIRIMSSAKEYNPKLSGEVPKVVKTGTDWVPGYFVDKSCYGYGYPYENNIFKSDPIDTDITNISVFDTTLDPYYSDSNHQVSWYIDFSNSLISIRLFSPRQGLIIFHENNDISSDKVFYCDFYIVDADTGPNPALYILLHRCAGQKIYNVENAGDIKSDGHESCICKVEVDRFGNLIFSDNTIFPSFVLKPSNPTLGCNPVPKISSFIAFIILLENIGKKIINREKKKLGLELEVFNFGSDEGFSSEIENNLRLTLENIYDLIFDYIPKGPLSNSCEGSDESNELEESEIDFESDSNDSITALIEEFLYLHCNAATLEDEPERGNYTVYRLVRPEHNKNNLINTIYDSLVQEERDTYQFCRETELGYGTPNSFVKNTGIYHSMILDKSSLNIPRIKGEYSEEDFVFKCNNSSCLNNIDDRRQILSEPRGKDRKKNCDQSNFDNSNEILGKCNVENKNLLTQVCNSYATPIGNLGYPYKCSISDLNRLTDYCNQNYDPDCSVLEAGCNIVDPQNNTKLKTYPSNLNIPFNSPIRLGGICSNHNVISREMELINSQSTINRETLEQNEKIRDQLLIGASNLNAAHAAESDIHQDNLKYIEEISEDTTRMRICNARKRKYDFENKVCSNEFLEFSVDDTNPEFYKCEQDRIDFEEAAKIRLYTFLFVFIILFSICFYFIFLR